MNRKTAFLLASAVAVGLMTALATVASARPFGAASGDGPRGAQGLEQMFQTFDGNGDGRLTQAEIDAYRRDRHASFDTNEDGAIALTEFEKVWLDAMRTPMTQRFQRLDANADGKVTAEEFGAPFAGMVQWLDTAEDGVVTRDDLTQLRRERMERRADMRDRWGPGSAGRFGAD